ncbi:MAG TPA: CopD family protein [Sphingomicrobium sp.]|jgi:putative membrane protein|nr:CopD family protein [Sphingomicrobium sp.]
MTGLHLTNFLGAAYLWVKAAHVTFVIFWMAGLFLLPRFFVYHQETVVGSPEDRAWIEREARVRSIILNPAIGLVWVLGLMLAFNIDAWHQGWFMAKFALVVALSAYQGWLGSYAKKLAAGQRPLSGRAVRMINEIPGIAAALIVVLVIVKPF